MSEPFTVCQRRDNMKGLFPGWLCCKCRVYNGYQRLHCKGCQHPSCFAVTSDAELLPIMRSVPGVGLIPDVISQRDRLAKEPPP